MDNENTDEGAPLVSTRTMEIVVALLLIIGSGIVIYDSMRVGHGWLVGVGPAPGYFPFWIAVIMGGSSIVTLATAIFRQGNGDVFVSAQPFRRVLAVLLPAIVYVALIGGFSLGPLEVPGIGIYVASAIFICTFMIAVGRQNPFKSIGVGMLVPVVLFFMFEIWFLVPLPKGPLESMLGY